MAEKYVNITAPVFQLLVVCAILGTTYWVAQTTIPEDIGTMNMLPELARNTTNILSSFYIVVIVVALALFAAQYKWGGDSIAIQASGYLYSAVLLTIAILYYVGSDTLLKNVQQFSKLSDLERKFLLMAQSPKFTDFFDRFIKSGVDVNSQQDNWFGSNETESDIGKTALHYQVKIEHFKGIQMLLAHKADVNIKDIGNNTAAHLVAKSKKIQQPAKLLSLLASHGADLNTGGTCAPNKPASVVCSGTPLQEAIAYDNPVAAIELLRLGAKFEERQVSELVKIVTKNYEKLKTPLTNVLKSRDFDTKAYPSLEVDS